jgi:thioredoxin-like negative regulator of GroEL
MFDRMVLTMVVIVAGIAAYQLLLFAQRRWVLNRSKREVGAGRAALLVFTSPTCAPCKLQQMPIVNRLMADWRDQVDLDVVDVVERGQVASQYGVWSVPTTIVLDAHRNVIAINQGVASERKLREQLEMTRGAKTPGVLGTRGEKGWQPS